MYYTILGVRVNTRTYEVLIKRYCHKKNKDIHTLLSINKVVKGSCISIDSNNNSSKSKKIIGSVKMRTQKNIRFSNASVFNRKN